MGQLQSRQVSPGSAHRIKTAAFQRFQNLCVTKVLINNFAGPRHVIARHIDQTQGAQRQGYAVKEFTVMDVNQLQRPATKVAHYPVGVGYTGNDAQCRIAGFFLPRQNMYA